MKESGARTYADSIGWVMERGHLAKMFDTDGKEYLDCLSCAGTLATGHNHPFILERESEGIPGFRPCVASVGHHDADKARFFEKIVCMSAGAIF